MSLLTRIFMHCVKTGDRVLPPQDPNTVGIRGVYEEDLAFIRDAMLRAKWEKPPAEASPADVIRELREEVRKLRAKVKELEGRLRDRR